MGGYSDADLERLHLIWFLVIRQGKRSIILTYICILETHAECLFPRLSATATSLIDLSLTNGGTK